MIAENSLMRLLQPMFSIDFINIQMIMIFIMIGPISMCITLFKTMVSSLPPMIVLVPLEAWRKILLVLSSLVAPSLLRTPCYTFVQVQFEFNANLLELWHACNHSECGSIKEKLASANPRRFRVRRRLFLMLQLF